MNYTIAQIGGIITLQEEGLHIETPENSYILFEDGIEGRKILKIIEAEASEAINKIEEDLVDPLVKELLNQNSRNGHAKGSISFFAGVSKMITGKHPETKKFSVFILDEIENMLL